MLIEAKDYNPPKTKAQLQDRINRAMEAIRPKPLNKIVDYKGKKTTIKHDNGMTVHYIYDGLHCVDTPDNFYRHVN